MPEGLVTITAYENAYEAHIAKTSLEDAGIHVFLQDTRTAGLLELSYAIGGIKLMVPSQDVERAKNLLAKINVATDQSVNDPTHQSETITCLSCGHDLPDDSDECPKCGWTYLE